MKNKTSGVKKALGWLLASVVIFVSSMFIASVNTSIASAVFLVSVLLGVFSVLKLIIAMVKGRRQKDVPVKTSQIPQEPIQMTKPQVQTAAPEPELEPEPKPTPSPVVSEPPVSKDVSTRSSIRVEGHKVAGTSHHREAIEAAGDYNDDYDMTAAEIRDSYDEGDRIYQYTFTPYDVKLVPEPENEYDSNAIRVEVDGQHIGYIKRGSTAHIHKLMREDRIVRIDVEMGGGKYKELDDEGDVMRDRAEYFAKLSIVVKD